MNILFNHYQDAQIPEERETGIELWELCETGGTQVGS